MADSTKEVTPEETGNLDNTDSTPPSPHGSMGKETLMADQTDDEIFIADATTKAKLAKEEENKKDTIPMDRDRTPPQPARERSSTGVSIPSGHQNGSGRSSEN